MKILIISNFFSPDFIGGAEIVAFSQAKELHKRGHKIIVITGKRFNTSYDHKITYEKTKTAAVYSISISHNEAAQDCNNFSNLKVDDLYKKVISEQMPDIIHTHNLSGLSTNIFSIAKQANIPIVATLHYYWVICPKNILINNLGLPCHNNNCDMCLESYSDGVTRRPISERNDYVKKEFLLSDLLISPSHFLLNEFIKYKFPANKFQVLSNGIEIKPITHNQTNFSQFFLSTSYLGWHKGVDLIIKAMSELKKHGYKPNLFIVGDGEEKNNLIELALRLKVNEQITFLGKIENKKVHKLMKDSIAIISGSRWPENQPVSILESFSFSKPVIAPNIGGIPELVKHNNTGFLYKADNYKELAKYMERYLLDQKLLFKHGKNARNFVTRKHNRIDTIEKLQEIYHKFVKID